MKPQKTALVILILAILAITVAVVKKTPKFGLDIAGGARVVLQADTTQLPKGQVWNADTRAAVLRTIERRVNSNGVSEPVITPKGTDQFVVEIPSVRNREEILEQLQNTAQLQFFYSPDWRTPANKLGRYDFQASSSPSGSREEYKIGDTTTGKTFRDLYHINGALRDLINAGSAKPGAVSTPLPAPLDTLPAAGANKSVLIQPSDAVALTALADELTQFNAFLAGAQLELDGSDLENASSGFDSGGSSGAVVEIKFNSTGTEKFANFTRDHTNEILLMYLDGQILMAPKIDEPILDGAARITPFGTLEDAKRLADYLNSGALPVPLHIIQQQTVEPTLGQGAVLAGLKAGIIGLVAIMGFMAIYYLLPGGVACFALLLYTLFTYAAFLLIGVTFTLPGIAGFILSVGMAVDANILIFERTKEELRDGRPLRQAIEHGFQRAFTAIFDSNVCTAVTSLLLYYFGTGPVRGFALTLLIGVAISMFTAITVSRTFLLLLVHGNQKPDLNAWGVNRQWHPRLNVVKSRPVWYGLSLFVIVPTVIFAAMGGFKPGIDFTGGNEFTLHFPTAVTRPQVEKAFEAQGIKEVAAQIGDQNTVFVRVPHGAGGEGKGELSSAQANQIVSQLGTTFPGVTLEGFEQIGSSISRELTTNAASSIVLSSIFIVFYLAFRFGAGGFVSGIKFGAAAIIAMLHDVLVLIGVFCALGYFLNWKIDSLFVTAALTVIGFSVHDTIVIFDRIRENLKIGGRKDADFGELVNRSIQETFARSINTSFTVVITLLALLIFGGPVIRPLNAALLIGIISGTYSSIFNAAPLVVDWQKRFLGGLALSGSGGRATSTAGGPSSPAPRPAVPVMPRPVAAPRTVAPPPTLSDSNGSASSIDGSDRGPALPSGPPRPRRRRM